MTVKIARTGLLIVSCVVLAQSGSALERIWGGAGAPANNNWHNTANWTGSTVPGATDIAVFDATATDNCSITGAVSIHGLEMRTGYSGTLTQVPPYATITLVTNGVFQAGTFMGSTNITINASYSNSGTIFTAPSGVLSVKFQFYNLGGGTFIHNNGTVKFTGAGQSQAYNQDKNYIWSGGDPFYHVAFAQDLNSARVLRDDMTVLGNVYHQQGHVGCYNGTGPGTNTVYLRGDYIGTSTPYAYKFGGDSMGRLTLEFNGGADQIVTQNIALSFAPYVVVNKSGGKVRQLSSLTGTRSMDIRAGNTWECVSDGDPATFTNMHVGGTFTNAGTLQARGGIMRFGAGFYNTGTYIPPIPNRGEGGRRIGRDHFLG